MATNRDLLKEAIADAKAVKETAIANAKAALEEAFTPFLKEKLSAKLTEMEEEEMEEEMYETEEKMDEMKKKEDENMMDEEVSLDELLAELEEESDMKDENYMEEELNEAKDEEEEMSIEDMSEDDLKSFIEDVIKDMVSAGELEAGHEGMENEEGAEEMGDEEEAGEEEELDEFNINELLAELDEAKDEEDVKEEKQPLNEFGLIGGLAALATALIAAKLATKEDVDKIAKEKKTEKEQAQGLADLITNKKSTSSMDEELAEAYSTVETLKSELNEINLLNAKLLYTNKIFRNKSLTESQKVKVLTAFDKATSKQEAQLVYETLLESLKVSTTKAPIKESLGSASKVLGGATSKPIIENDAFARMRELAFGGKK